MFSFGRDEAAPFSFGRDEAAPFSFGRDEAAPFSFGRDEAAPALQALRSRCERSAGRWFGRA